MNAYILNAKKRLHDVWTTKTFGDVALRAVQERANTLKRAWSFRSRSSWCAHTHNTECRCLDDDVHVILNEDQLKKTRTTRDGRTDLLPLRIDDYLCSKESIRAIRTSVRSRACVRACVLASERACVYLVCDVCDFILLLTEASCSQTRLACKPVLACLRLIVPSW